MPGLNATAQQDYQDFMKKKENGGSDDPAGEAEKVDEDSKNGKEADPTVGPMVSNTLILSAIIDIMIKKGITTEDDLINAMTEAAINPGQEDEGEEDEDAEVPSEVNSAGSQQNKSQDSNLMAPAGPGQSGGAKQGGV